MSGWPLGFWVFVIYSYLIPFWLLRFDFCLSMLWILLKMAKSEHNVITSEKLCLSLCSEIDMSTMIDECLLRLVDEDPLSWKGDENASTYIHSHPFVYMINFYWYIYTLYIYIFELLCNYSGSGTCSETNRNFCIEVFWLCSWGVGSKKNSVCKIENLIYSLTANDGIVKTWKVL